MAGGQGNALQSLQSGTNSGTRGFNAPTNMQPGQQSQGYTPQGFGQPAYGQSQGYGMQGGFGGMPGGFGRATPWNPATQSTAQPSASSQPPVQGAALPMDPATQGDMARGFMQQPNPEFMRMQQAMMQRRGWRPPMSSTPPDLGGIVQNASDNVV